jgi:hypothetical protein
MSMEKIGNSVSSAVVNFMGLSGLSAAAVGVIGVLAGFVFAIAWMIYARAGQPMLQHAAADGGSTRALADPTRHRMLGLEWAGLIVAALAFSPQTNSPHLVQLLLVAMAIAAALLAPAPQCRIGFKLAVASALILLAGLTLPPGGSATRELVPAFQRAGWPAWTMLASYLLLLAAAVPRPPAVIQTSDSPAVGA